MKLGDMPDLMKIRLLDDKIKSLRKKVRNSEEVEEIYYYFELLDKTQRERFSQVGKFLPCPNGKVYTYDPNLDLWLHW